MSVLFTTRPTWTEINLENLAFNFQSVKTFIGTYLSLIEKGLSLLEITEYDNFEEHNYK